MRNGTRDTDFPIFSEQPMNYVENRSNNVLRMNTKTESWYAVLVHYENNC